MIIISDKIFDAVNYAITTTNPNITRISKQFGIDRHSLSKYMKYDMSEFIYCSTKQRYIQLTEKELEAVSYYLSREDIAFSDIKRVFGFKQSTFKNILESAGISNERRYKKQFNRNLFQEIKTEHDAYFLGFITADGYVNEDRGFLSINQKIEDRDVLDKFLDYANANFSVSLFTNNITNRKIAAAELDCRNVVDNLVKLGIRQAKSTKEKPILNMPELLIRHYIRGFFDGDGYVSKKHNKIGCCGSFEMLEYIILAINKYLDVPIINVKQENKSALFRLCYCGSNAKKVMEYLYKDSTVHLDRKYLLAMSKI